MIGRLLTRLKLERRLRYLLERGFMVHPPDHLPKKKTMDELLNSLRRPDGNTKKDNGRSAVRL